MRFAVLFIAAASACTAADPTSELSDCGAQRACATGYSCGGDGRCHQIGTIGGAGNVKVTYTDVVSEGFPTVSFLDADGKELASVLTDTAFSASHDVPAGGSVTVGIASDYSAELTTILGVQPGDVLEVGRYLVPDGPSVGKAHITASQPYSGAYGYTIALGCDASEAFDPGSTSNVDLIGSCQDAHGNVSVLAEALGVQSDSIAFSYVKGAPIVAGVVDVTLPAWAPAHATTINFTNIPPYADTIDLGVGFVVDGAVVGGWHESAPVGGSVVDPLSMPTPAGAFVDSLSLAITSVLTPIVGDLNTQLGLYVVGAPLTAPVTIDLAKLPPILTRIDLSTTDPTRPAVSWQTERPFPEASVIELELTWTVGAVNHTWTILGPPNAMIVAPALPAALGLLRPDANVKDLKVALLALVGRSDTAGYRAWLSSTHGHLPDLQPGVQSTPGLELRYSFAGQ
jgi:hypothetical protein